MSSRPKDREAHLVTPGALATTTEPSRCQPTEFPHERSTAITAPNTLAPFVPQPPEHMLSQHPNIPYVPGEPDLNPTAPDVLALPVGHVSHQLDDFSQDPDASTFNRHEGQDHHPAVPFAPAPGTDLTPPAMPHHREAREHRPTAAATLASAVTTIRHQPKPRSQP